MFRDLKVFKEFKGAKEIPEQSALQDTMGAEVFRVFKVFKEPTALRVSKVLRVPREFKVSKDLLVLKESKEYKEY